MRFRICKRNIELLEYYTWEIIRELEYVCEEAKKELQKIVQIMELKGKVEEMKDRIMEMLWEPVEEFYHYSREFERLTRIEERKDKTRKKYKII